MSSQDTRIPITLLTGFLGAGKTSLLNTLLWQKDFEDAAVFINEFGEVGVDHLLVEKIDENIMLLDSGCICCSLRGDLPEALRNLFNRARRAAIPMPKRVVIETSGIADPAPVIYTLLHDHFISGHFRLDGVVAVVAATHGTDQIEINVEALRQVAMADRLVISKCDLASAEQIAQIAARLAALNPTAVQLRSEKGSIAAADVLDVGLYDPVDKAPDVRTWLADIRVAEQAELRRLSYSRKRPTTAHSPHIGDVESFVLKFDAPLGWSGLRTMLDALLQGHGEQILRIKGLVNIAGEPGPRIVQCVQHTRCPSVRLDAWPDDAAYADRKSRLVFITRKLSEAHLRASLAQITRLIAKYGITA